MPDGSPVRLRISREELQQRSLFVATPVYGGQPFGHFTHSLQQLMMFLQREGLTGADHQTFNESLVPRARNYLAWEFLRSGMTHMLFVDADIEFSLDDVMTLLVLADPGSDKDVVCGAYPKKHIAWDRIVSAVKAGFADEDPSVLEEFVGEFFFTPVDPHAPHDLGEPLEVTETGTGFMMIQRHVLERFAEAYPERWYHTDDFRERRRYQAFFSEEVVPHDKVGHRLLSEDFNFCRLVREAGMKVWVVPKINLGHLGFYKFRGNIEALAAASQRKD